MSNKGKVSLERFERGKDGNPHIYVYKVEQNNGTTSVDQQLIIKASGSSIKAGWSASIVFDDFPAQSSGKDAALKLADWMERLAAAIRCGEYPELHSDEFKDIEDVSNDKED